MLNEEEARSFCPDCVADLKAPAGGVLGNLGRREFIRVLGGGAALAAGLGSGLSPRRLLAQDAPAASAAKAAKPAEALIRELYATLTSEQKTNLVLPWNHGAEKGAMATRLRMYNAPIEKKFITDSYTKPQKELVERILKSICAGDEGYHLISRGGDFDGSGSLDGCGALIFGTPEDGQKYSWVFTGHHITVRCDGNSEEGAAFGGPMYYGHSPNGYSKENVFNFQTKSVLSVFDSLNDQQRKKAIVPGTPGEQAASVKLRPANQTRPGIAYQELTSDQQSLVSKVMRDVLSPYRKEDADEVMEIVKATGGMEKINLAFYEDSAMKDGERWHFWRLEGPGFVWNYRVLPHVHTFVNITSKLA